MCRNKTVNTLFNEVLGENLKKKFYTWKIGIKIQMSSDIKLLSIFFLIQYNTTENLEIHS